MKDPNCKKCKELTSGDCGMHSTSAGFIPEMNSMEYRRRIKMKDKKVVAYVIAKAGDTWDNVCQTEYLEDGTWISGMNLITGINDILERAEKNKVNIVFESMLEGGDRKES